ncbi:peptidylprolyl isomerase [Pelagibacteraceae bacterium]|nr:peptidylprolyl isomerase [Pelagibacteraceae bacterium]
MKKCIIIFFFIASFFLQNNLSAKVENKIILKVENKIITNFEIKNKILRTLIIANVEINQKNINDLKQRALEFLIQNKLQEIELSKHNFTSDKSKINEYIESVTSSNLNDLKKKFNNNKIDYQLFLQEIETQLKWQKLIYQIYSSKIEIDEKLIEEELKILISKKSTVEDFRLSEIVISYDNSQNDKDKIKKIEKLIKETSFENVVFKFSNSSTSSNKGDLGWVNSKSLSNKIYTIVDKMKINDVSKPILRQNNILFLKLLDKKTSKTNNDNIVQLKKNLVDQKKNDLFDLYSRSHLSKLRNTSIIEYK